VADVDRTDFPVALGRYPRRIHLDQPAARPQRPRSLPIIDDVGISMAKDAPRPHPTNDVGDLAVACIE
jgi:hypothetical protein